MDRVPYRLADRKKKTGLTFYRQPLLLFGLRQPQRHEGITVSSILIIKPRMPRSHTTIAVFSRVSARGIT